MNRSIKFVLVVGLVLLVWATVLVMTVNASSDERVSALTGSPIFALQPPPTSYTLTVTVNPGAGGAVTKNPNLPVYISGMTVTLVSSANSGYVFNDWSGCDAPSGTTCVMTMNTNKSVTANFSQTATATATATATPTPSRTATRTTTPTMTGQPTSTPTATTQPTVTPVATITPLSGGVVVATITTVSTPTSALPSTGASPLTWTAAGIVLVLIAVGARYWRQSST